MNSYCISLIISSFIYINVASSSVLFKEVGDIWSKHHDPLSHEIDSAKKTFSDSMTNALRDSLDKALKENHLCEKLNENDHITLFQMFHQVANSCTSASFSDLPDHKAFGSKLDDVKKSSFDVKSKGEKICLGSKYADLSAWNDKTVCEEDPTSVIESGIKSAHDEMDKIKSEFDSKKIIDEYQNFVKTCFTKGALQKWIDGNKTNFANLCAH